MTSGPHLPDDDQLPRSTAVSTDMERTASRRGGWCETDFAARYGGHAALTSRVLSRHAESVLGPRN